MCSNMNKCKEADDSAIKAVVEGRAFLDENGSFLTPDEYFFNYHSETDFSGEE